MLDASAGASRGSGDSRSKVRPAPGSLGCRTCLVVALRGSSVSYACHNLGSVCCQVLRQLAGFCQSTCLISGPGLVG